MRAYRESLGWSQQDLAERAGVSRQMVGAVEAGRHVPNVRAALALAGSLGVSVEELFLDATAEPVPVIGDDFPAVGSPAVVTRVGEQMVVAVVDHGVADSERWAVVDATIGAGGVVLLDDALVDGLVVAGCDPALGVLAGLVERVSPHRVVTVHASTGRSIDALAAGRVHGVVVHAPSGRFATPPVPVRRWQLACWQVGVASGRVAGVPTVDEIAERRLRVVQRDSGAGTQQAFSRALERIGGPASVPGPVGEGHVDVARRVAAGATAGLTMEAAARSFGLGFAALEEHAVELWLDERWASLPAAVTIVDVLNSASLRSRLELIGGYDLTGCGTERYAG